jgi:hypothetical protein
MNAKISLLAWIVWYFSDYIVFIYSYKSCIFKYINFKVSLCKKCLRINEICYQAWMIKSNQNNYEIWYKNEF